METILILLANEVVSSCSQLGPLVNKFEQVLSHGDPTYPHLNLHILGLIAPSPSPLPTWDPTHGNLLDLFKLVHFGKRAVGLRLKNLLVTAEFLHRKSPSRPQTDRESAFWALFRLYLLFFCHQCSYFQESIT